MTGEKYNGFDEDDIPDRIPHMSEEQGDLIAEERAQREVDDFDIDRLNDAIRKCNANLRWPI